MRKILSLVLAFALILGSFPLAFADAATSGAQLQEWKIVQGDLMSDAKMTREMAITYFVRLLGEEAAALAYAEPTTFTDVAKTHWSYKYIAYAEAKKYTNGIGAGKFGLGQEVSTQQLAAFVVRGLGYADVAYADVMAKATELKLLTNVTAAAGDKITRGTGFEVLINTLNTPLKGQTVALKYVLKLVAAPTAALAVSSVSVVNGTVVDVKLTTAVTAADVTAAIMSAKDAAGVALEIKSKELSTDGKTITLITAAQTTAAKYVLTVGTATYDFIGGVVDTAAPSAIAVTPVDNTTVEVTFTDASSRLDKTSATNVANYTIAGLTVSAAELDGKVVTLTTSAQTSGTVYTLSVNGVKDVAGNAMTTAKTATFAGKLADTAAPSAITVTPYSNNKVIVLFTDASDIDAGTAQNIANYSFDKSLTVTAAMLVATTDDATLYGTTKNKAVVLTTSAQTTGTVYTITVNGVADVKGNAIKTAKTATFAGKAADVAAPSAVTVTPYSNTEILVTFTDASNIDATTAAVAANYTIDKSLTVVSAALITTSANATKYGVTANKTVLVTTSAQTTGTVYTLSVIGVADVAANAITTAKTATFAGKAADTAKPTVTSVTSGA